MIVSVLLLVAALTHLAPEHLARWLGHRVVAWETVAYGVEATCLWLAVASFAKHAGRARWPLLGIAAYGTFESIQRPICRLFFPMDQVLSFQPGVYMCDAAGWHTSELSTVALALTASVVAATNSRS